MTSRWFHNSLKPTVPAYLDPAYNISDFATGVCFASGVTGYDNATSNVDVSVQLITLALPTQRLYLINASSVSQ